MEIINEVKLKESKDDKKEKPKFVARNLAEIQKAKLDKLMKNPDKLIIIPERKEKDFSNSIPTFVRNVMGSSAGAGSGEFHVYRHLRRKEFARQKHIQEKSRKEELDDEYHNKLEENKTKADSKTAKKRAKRLKQKEKAKVNAKKPKIDNATEENSDESSANESEEEDTEEKVPISEPETDKVGNPESDQKETTTPTDEPSPDRPESESSNS